MEYKEAPDVEYTVLVLLPLFVCAAAYGDVCAYSSVIVVMI